MGPVEREPAWAGVLARAAALTCYSAALGCWCALRGLDSSALLDQRLHLALEDAGGGLFAFGHFAPGFRSAVGLARACCDDADEAAWRIAEEASRSGAAIITADGHALPWHTAHGRRHLPHWFVVAPRDGGLEVLDAFTCRTDLGWQRPARLELTTEDIAALVGTVPADDPVLGLRERFALGDDDPVSAGCFQWLVRSAPEPRRLMAGAQGSDAVHRLAQHFADHGSEVDAYRQSDDVWSVGRHRALCLDVARDAANAGDDERVEWLRVHGDPLATAWTKVPALCLHASLRAKAGSPDAGAQLAELLHDVADREAAAGRDLRGSDGEASPNGDLARRVELSALGEGV